MVDARGTSVNAARRPGLCYCALILYAWLVPYFANFRVDISFGGIVSVHVRGVDAGEAGGAYVAG